MAKDLAGLVGRFNAAHAEWTEEIERRRISGDWSTPLAADIWSVHEAARKLALYLCRRPKLLAKLGVGSEG